MNNQSCSLCTQKEETTIFSNDFCRLISTDDSFNLGVHRLIWNNHMSELSQLTKKNQIYLFDALIQAEKIVVKKYNPHKINVASIGNQVPHLHFHIIPRWITDPWWPYTIWSQIPKLEWNTFSTNVFNLEKMLVSVGDWPNLAKYSESIRKKVFIDDQKIIFSKQLDNYDLISRHALIKSSNIPLATGRMQPCGRLSRIAVIKEFRKKGLEKGILSLLELEAKRKKIKEISVNSEINNCEFYFKNGFSAIGPEFFKCNFIQQKMIKKLYY